MTLDEAKLALTVHGQEAFKDLFQPCTCGGGLTFFRVATKLPVEPRSLPNPLPKELCRACKALEVVSAAVAVAGLHAEESPLFTKLVERYYPGPAEQHYLG
jgi:hypothetical protein